MSTNFDDSIQALTFAYNVIEKQKVKVEGSLNGEAKSDTDWYNRGELKGVIFSMEILEGLIHKIEEEKKQLKMFGV